MKKLFTTLAVCALATVSLNAQSLFNNSDNHRHFGAELSLDISCPSDAKAKFNKEQSGVDGLINGAGFSLTAYYHVPIWWNLYAEPGVGIFYHTTGLQDAVIAEMNKNDTEEHNYTGASLREFGINIPIIIGYHFDFDFINLKARVFTGPVFSVATSGKAKLEARFDDRTWMCNESLYDKGGLNRGNIAWRFGVGVDYKNKYRLSIYGDAGMTNALNDVYTEIDNTDVKMKLYRNTFNIALGYNF